MLAQLVYQGVIVISECDAVVAQIVLCSLLKRATVQRRVTPHDMCEETTENFGVAWAKAFCVVAENVRVTFHELTASLQTLQCFVHQLAVGHPECFEILETHITGVDRHFLPILRITTGRTAELNEYGPIVTQVDASLCVFSFACAPDHFVKHVASCWNQVRTEQYANPHRQVCISKVLQLPVLVVFQDINDGLVAVGMEFG